MQLIDAIWYAGVQWVGTAVIFAAADPLLLIPLVVWLAAYIVVLVIFVPRIKQRSTEASEARSMLVGRIVDTYTNILTVKLFAHADREDAYARSALQEQMGKWQASLRVQTAMELVLYGLNGMLIVGACGLAIWLWTYDAVSIGAIAVVSGLVMRIVAMSGWILWVVAGIFENIGVVEEGMEAISRPNLVVDQPDSQPLVVRQGAIRFENISFHYGQKVGAGTARPGGIIHNLSLDIAPGEKVGLVGRSGAGKSTLVNLLLRFYDLEAGRITIDGQDIAHVTQDSLRAQIGMVTQDTSLMHRSVRDNILYGRPGAGDEATIAAAKRAQADTFIATLEDMRGRKAYGAHVGERGVKLSGGQRQRVAIARVLLKNAPILILDEATSALELGGGAGHPGAALQSDVRQDGDRHRPPPVDDRRHGPAGDPRPGPRHRGRQPRRPAEARRPLRRPVVAPVRRLPGQGGGGVTRCPTFARAPRIAVRMPHPLPCPHRGQEAERLPNFPLESLHSRAARGQPS